MTRPIRAHIDLAALRANLGVARRTAPRSRIMAVLKANAYGHGLRPVARALGGADAIAVLDLHDAVRLREAGESRPLVLLEGFFSPQELPELVQHDATPVVHSVDQVAMLEAARQRPRAVHVKVNTGMNRLGLRPGALADALARLRRLGIEDVTLMTHFACADETDGVAAQLALFSGTPGVAGHPRSMANSAALLGHPDTHADWVRPGIMLYGASPFADRTAESLGLVPAMTLTSELIAVLALDAGECVGYGGTFRALHAMRAGIVACGYADGYPRHAPTGTPVLVEGVRTRLIGRVSMDMLCVDLDPVPFARVGSQVTLWGQGLSVDEVAQAAGTIGYELLCALAPRVPMMAHAAEPPVLGQG